MRHLFDIRNIIGSLLGIYGVVLTIAGFAPGLLGDHHKGASDNPVDLYIGTDANWWVGLVGRGDGRRRARPVKVPETTTQTTDPEH